jgi:hypothetical protein
MFSGVVADVDVDEEPEMIAGPTPSTGSSNAMVAALTWQCAFALSARPGAARQRRLSTTMIYVTHDQIEAMTMADRIADGVGARICLRGVVCVPDFASLCLVRGGRRLVF